MIIVSSRKFRDSQNEFFALALEEEVILKTLHYGNFRLVPIKEEKKKRGRKPKSVKDQKGVIVIPTEIATKENVVIETVQEPILENSEEIIEIKNESSVIEKQEMIIPAESEETYVNKSDEEVIEENIINETIHIEDENKAEVINEVKEDLSTPEQESTTTETLAIIENSQVENTEIHVDQSWKPGRVFVDPSLLSLEEVRIQEGLEDNSKKKGLFSKLFGKKK